MGTSGSHEFTTPLQAFEDIKMLNFTSNISSLASPSVHYNITFREHAVFLIKKSPNIRKRQTPQLQIRADSKTLEIKCSSICISWDILSWIRCHGCFNLIFILIQGFRLTIVFRVLVLLRSTTLSQTYSLNYPTPVWLARPVLSLVNSKHLVVIKCTIRRTLLGLRSRKDINFGAKTIPRNQHLFVNWRSLRARLYVGM